MHPPSIPFRTKGRGTGSKNPWDCHHGSNITWSQDVAVTNFTVRDHSVRGEGEEEGRGSITWSQDVAVTNFTVRDHSVRGEGGGEGEHHMVPGYGCHQLHGEGSQWARGVGEGIGIRHLYCFSADQSHTSAAGMTPPSLRPVFLNLLTLIYKFECRSKPPACMTRRVLHGTMLSCMLTVPAPR